MLDMSAKETSSHMYLYDHGKAVMDTRLTQSSLGHAICAREPGADGRDAGNMVHGQSIGHQVERSEQMKSEGTANQCQELRLCSCPGNS